MLIAFVSLISIIIAYFFIKPYLRTKAQRATVLRIYLILIPLSLVAYGILRYFMFYSNPESFEKGVELLRKNKDIRNCIGGFESYTYFDKDLPKKTDNPALFKVSIKGSKATIYLSCKMNKDTSGIWHLVDIKQDSIKK